MSASAIVAGNVYDKYGSRNPVARRLVAGFLGALDRLVRGVDWRSALEVGAGEGHLTMRLRALSRPGARIVSCDLVCDVLDREAAARAGASLLVADAVRLPVRDGAFDLVVACEVLEHLHDPVAAIDELARTTRRWALASVPCEPLWRILNLARGAYVRDFGNTPGHIQHFSRRAFVTLVERRFRVSELATPLPWTMALLEKRA